MRPEDIDKVAAANPNPNPNPHPHPHPNPNPNPYPNQVALPGAETLVLDGVTHFPWSDVFGGAQFAPELAEEHRNGKPWYGTPETVEQWAPWLEKQ